MSTIAFSMRFGDLNGGICMQWHGFCHSLAEHSLKPFLGAIDIGSRCPQALSLGPMNDKARICRHRRGKCLVVNGHNGQRHLTFVRWLSARRRWFVRSMARLRDRARSRVMLSSWLPTVSENTPHGSTPAGTCREMSSTQCTRSERDCEGMR